MSQEAIVYYTPLCPECPPFIEEVKRQGLDVTFVNITESIGNLKKFIQMRDSEPAFADRRQWGFVGVPVLKSKDGKYIFDLNDLKGISCSATSFEK